MVHLKLLFITSVVVERRVMSIACSLIISVTSGGKLVVVVNVTEADGGL